MAQPITYQFEDDVTPGGVTYQFEDAASAPMGGLPPQPGIGDALKKRYGTAKEVITAPGWDPANVFYKTLVGQGQMAGAVNDVIGAGVVQPAFNMIVPDPDTRADIGQFMSEMPGVQTAKKLWGQAESVAPAATLGVESAANIASVVPQGWLAGKGINAATGAAKGIGGIARDANMAIKSRSVVSTDAAINKAITTGVQKYIRPSYAGKSDAALSGKFYENAQTAIKDIVNRYPGEPLSKADDIVQEFSNRVYATKNQIWDEAGSLRDRARKAGVLIDTQPTVTDLLALANDEAIRKANPALAKAYIDEAAAISQGERYVNPKVAEEMLAQLNARAKAFWKDPNTNIVAVVPARAGNVLRKTLFDAMEELGPEYKDLRSRYGAQLAIEREVQNRATQVNRKPEYGLFDFANVAAARDFAVGVVRATKGDFTGLLGSVVILAEKNRMKGLNDVSTGIRNMFKDVELLTEIKKKFGGPDPLGAQMPKQGPYLGFSDVNKLIAERQARYPAGPESGFGGPAPPVPYNQSPIPTGNARVMAEMEAAKAARDQAMREAMTGQGYEMGGVTSLDPAYSPVPMIPPQAGGFTLPGGGQDIFSQRLPSTSVVSGRAQGLERAVPNLQHPIPLNSLKDMTPEQLRQYLLRQRVTGMMDTPFF